MTSSLYGQIRAAAGRVAHAPRRVLVLVGALLMLAHFYLYWNDDRYYVATSPWEWFRVHHPPRAVPEEYYHIPAATPIVEKANAALVMLTKNYELNDVLESMKFVEDRFNKQFRYPWVFLSEVPFNRRFKQATREITDANVTFGVIDPSEWYQPSWIDEDRAEISRKQMDRMHVLFAKSVPYRNTCRFNSGFIFNNKYLREYRYYWRISPGVEYYCDMTRDPFLFMQDNNKVYGFVMSMYEYPRTIPTLWDTVKNFTLENPQFVKKDNAMAFISRDEGKSYNLCHFWNNFEIVDMAFFRSQVYTKFFEYLDATGGFYYERWSDAVVHTLAVALFANRSQIHFFDDIGYRHEPYQHCPQGAAHAQGRCMCLEKNTFGKYFRCGSRVLLTELAADNSRFSCLKHFLGLNA